MKLFYKVDFLGFSMLSLKQRKLLEMIMLKINMIFVIISKFECTFVNNPFLPSVMIVINFQCE